MFYLIKRSGVYSAPTLKALNKKMGIAMVESEFTIVGKDFISKLTDEDFDFVQDKHKMEDLLFAGFFKKDNSAKLLATVNLIFTFVIMIMISKIGG